MTLLADAADAPDWRRATGFSAVPGATPFVHPYLGHPTEHQCESLHSKRLSVSVVLPSWNSFASLRLCLAALERCSINRLAPSRLQVIVCDDGSTDNTWDGVRHSRSTLDLVVLRLRHSGQSFALNQGLRAAEGDVVILCDSDMVLGCGAVDELVSRHEEWESVVCFGFRSDALLDDEHLSAERLWSLIHTEAFSRDNRIRFHMPALSANMLLDSDWLASLGAGKYMLDSQGGVWRRHRFLFGCLFSASRRLLASVGGMPEVLPGWGYQDTLVAARLEAEGAFLLPVMSAWGHHAVHPLRDADQWFRYDRNRLAYDFALTCEVASLAWRRPHLSSVVIGEHRVRSVGPRPSAAGRGVSTSATVEHSLGRWSESLELQSPGDDLRAECLFRLGRFDELREAPEGSFWAAAALASEGRLMAAREALTTAALTDPLAAYVLGSSPLELHRLGAHHASHGMMALGALHDVGGLLLD